MSRNVLLIRAKAWDSFKERHPWLVYFWEGGRIWATRLGCVWIYPDKDIELD